jgi:hypothetical protein
MAGSSTLIARAFGGTRPPTLRHVPRIQGEPFIRSLEIVSLFLQHNEPTLRRMLDDTPAETIADLTYALLALAYMLDEAQHEHPRPR